MQSFREAKTPNKCIEIKFKQGGRMGGKVLAST